MQGGTPAQALHDHLERLIMTTNPQDLIIAYADDPHAEAWPIRLGGVDLRINLVETKRGYRAHRLTSTCEYVSTERTFASEVLEDVAAWLDNPLTASDCWTLVL
jgi:hypothetical protein